MDRIYIEGQRELANDLEAIVDCTAAQDLKATKVLTIKRGDSVKNAVTQIIRNIIIRNRGE